MEYIVTVRDNNVIDQMRENRMNIYVPALKRDWVILVTNLSMEKIMALDGVLHCEESRTFSLNAKGGRA